MNINTPKFLTCVYLELFDHPEDAMVATVIAVA
jgi:hypothetical protein